MSETPKASDQKRKPTIRYGHLLLFAVLPLLNFFNINSQELSFNDPEVGQFLLFNLAVLAIAFSVAILFLKKLERAAILATFLVVLFFSYGHFVDSLKSVPLILSVYTASAAVVFVALSKTGNNNLMGINKTLTAVGIVLASLSLTSLVPKEIKQHSSNPVEDQEVQDPRVSSGEGHNMPDVYYILPDSYPRNDILLSRFNFDNTSFTKSLEDKGFYVAKESNSNYAFTSFSVPSTLNMRYHTSLNPIEEMINLRQSKAVLEFKSRGYKLIHIGTGWRGSKILAEDSDIKLTGEGGIRSINALGIEFKLSEFLIVYTRTTAIRPFLDKQVKKGLSNTVLDAFSAIKKVPEIDKPTFTFVHLMVPHPPFIFDESGPIQTQELELISEEVFRDKNSFLKQLKFTNKLIIETVEVILNKSEKPPIIVLASDHGSATDLGHPDSWSNPGKHNIKGVKERMAILNAYFFPDRKYSKLYPEISPINTFPLILNQYFGGNHLHLPDKNYFSNYHERYRFFDVTGVVRQ